MSIPFFGQAKAAAATIVAAFQDTNSLPKPLSQVFIHRHAHYRKWSWGNQLLVALHGYTDARTFKQWKEHGRQVKKGEKAFFILAPMKKKVVDKDTQEEKTVIYGFKGLPVFGLEQTEGPPLPDKTEIDQWIDTLPLIEVARAWGLKVEAQSLPNALGAYQFGKAIRLSVKNLSVWSHELIHAADDKNGNLLERGQQLSSETVATLGGAVLLELLGFHHDSDIGGCWQYINSYAKKSEVDVTEACMQTLERTCLAVALVRDTADDLKASCGCQYVADHVPDEYTETQCRLGSVA